MTEINYITGDATRPHGIGNILICHICNDIGKWGKGFVLALSKRWPDPEREYKKWFRGKLAGPNDFALGSVQYVEVEPHIAVANIIGQHGIYPKDGVQPVRYDAIREALGYVREYCDIMDAEVHMPRMGAGLAGGDWKTIESIIREELCAHGVHVTVYDLKE